MPPPELTKLSFMEKSMISPILAMVKVGKTCGGQLKLLKHAIAFPSKNFEITRSLPHKPTEVLISVHVNVTFNEGTGFDDVEYSFPEDGKIYKIRRAEINAAWAWCLANNSILQNLDATFDIGSNYVEVHIPYDEDSPVEERLHSNDNESNSFGEKNLDEQILEKVDISSHIGNSNDFSREHYVEDKSDGTHIYLANKNVVCNPRDTPNFLEQAFVTVYPDGRGGPTERMMKYVDQTITSDETEKKKVESFSHYFKHLQRLNYVIAILTIFYLIISI